MSNPYQSPDAPLVTASPPSDRPWHIRYAAYGFGMVLALNLAALFGFADMSLMTAGLWVAYALVNGVVLVFVLLVWHGRSWARFVYAFLMFFELCKRIWFLSVIWHHSPISVAIAMATALTEIVVIVLLLHKRSAAWCREVGAWKLAARGRNV